MNLCSSFMVMCTDIFCGLLFVLFSLFFWLLYCLSFFDFQFLITPLLSTTFSCTVIHQDRTVTSTILLWYLQPVHVLLYIRTERLPVLYSFSIYNLFMYCYTLGQNGYQYYTPLVSTTFSCTVIHQDRTVTSTILLQYLQPVHVLLYIRTERLPVLYSFVIYNLFMYCYTLGQNGYQYYTPLVSTTFSCTVIHQDRTVTSTILLQYLQPFHVLLYIRTERLPVLYSFVIYNLFMYCYTLGQNGYQYYTPLVSTTFSCTVIHQDRTVTSTILLQYLQPFHVLLYIRTERLPVLYSFVIYNLFMYCYTLGQNGYQYYTPLVSTTCSCTVIHQDRTVTSTILLQYLQPVHVLLYIRTERLPVLYSFGIYNLFMYCYTLGQNGYQYYTPLVSTTCSCTVIHQDRTVTSTILLWYLQPFHVLLCIRTERLPVLYSFSIYNLFMYCYTLGQNGYQ